MRSRIPSSPIVVLALACFLLSVPGLSVAQTAAPAREASARPEQGGVIGFVTSPDGARLPGVVVTITEVGSGATLTVVTGEHGGYRRTGLEPGRYEIRADLDGFQTQILRDLEVAEGQTREVDFTMAPASYHEVVSVVATTARDSIQASEIRASTARDIGEALSRMTGISKIRKGGLGNDVVLNGYQGKDLTVLIDGQKVYGACPSDMDPAVFHADFAEVDHIEVGKGPFDILNQGSLGGVINIVTRKPAEGFHAEPTFSIGSFGYVNPSATISYGSRKVSALGGYSYRASDPYRDGSGKRFTEYANYRSASAGSQAFGANTGWLHLFVSPHDGHTIHVSYTRQRADDVLYPYLQMDAIDDHAERLGFAYDVANAHGPIRSVATQAYYTRVGHSMTDQFRTSSVGSMQPYSMITQADSSIAGGKVQVDIAGVIAGIDGSRRSWNATTSMLASQFQPKYAIPDVTTDSLGAYAQYRTIAFRRNAPRRRRPAGLGAQRRRSAEGEHQSVLRLPRHPVDLGVERDAVGPRPPGLSRIRHPDDRRRHRPHRARARSAGALLRSPADGLGLGGQSDASAHRQHGHQRRRHVPGTDASSPRSACPVTG